jgi:membrane protein YdbS with pleckstrin-like domain
MTDFREPEPESSGPAAVESGQLAVEPGQPAVESGQPAEAAPGFERLDPRVVPYWLLSGSFGVLVLGAIGGAALLAFRASLGEAARPVLILAATLFGLMLLWQLIAPPLAYRRWRFRIDEDLLVARYGIVFHEEKAIPVSRLQHVDLTRGPIERLFGLATLVVHTAGTEAASFRLPGLAAARAAGLRDLILEARGDDVV